VPAEVLLGFPERYSVGAAAGVDVVVLDVVILPAAHRTNGKSARRRLPNSVWRLQQGQPYRGIRSQANPSSESRLCAVQRSLDELKLGCSGKPLDPGLFASRGRSIANRDHNRELNRSSAARVAAGGAGTVCGQSPLDVGRPSAVERVVGAAKQVDGSHPHGFARATTITCLQPRLASSVTPAPSRERASREARGRRPQQASHRR
jgi:hypothetical protein